MRFGHQFAVPTPLAAVADFHRRPASLVALTPPPLVLSLDHPEALLGEGADISFTIWLGPLPIRWNARIEGLSPCGFADRQISGPFASWTHRHTFVSAGERWTVVMDDVSADLRRHPFWGPIGLLLWLGMPALFAYREWRTRHALTAPPAGRAQVELR
jgi:ligand-binding SRPBCC domain-containing protein